MLSLKRSTRGISKLAFLILLIVSATIGAVLSYMWTEAYYIEAGHKVPEGVVTVTITNVTFPIQNATYFNLTVLTPSFSHEDAYITRIALGKNASTSGFETIQIIPPESVEPSTPYPLARSEEVTFRCNQNWGALAGENIYVAVFLQDGSGSTFPFETGKVRLEVTEVDIDTTVTIERFNLTVRNSDESIIPLNVTEIMFDSATIPSHNITASSANATFPLQLLPGQAETLICNWNLWKKADLGSPHTLTAKTAQGYLAVYSTGIIPAAASLNITDVVFALPHTNSFNITVANQQSSPHFVDIDRITIKNGTQIYENITIEDVSWRISPGNNLTFRCLWNWEAFKECNVEVTVHTVQGFYVEKQVYIQEAYGLPVASFEYSPIPAYTGNVTFNATESYDTYGSIISYFWDFGDGTNGTDQVIIHNYEENNNYTVSLTVTDNDGLTDIAQVNVTVLNRHPIASFSESTETAYVGVYISFNASESYDPDGSIVNYFWDFSDGTNATGIVVDHAFSSNGTFIVTLTVTDDDGDTGTINATKTILNPPPSTFLKTLREIVPSSEGMLQSIGYAHFNLIAYHHCYACE